MKIVTLILTAVLAVSSAFCAEPAPASRFSSADDLFLHRARPGNAEEALRQYRAFYKDSPDADAAWRVSMACYFVGFNIVRDKATKKRLYAEGRDAGLYAVAHSTGSASAHFWTAINMALYGETVGVVKMLFTLGTVREHLRRSVALDPSYAYAGAYRILGKIDESLPAILGGSDAHAQAYYRKAILLAPDEPVNYLFLARLLLERYDQRTEAYEVARQGLSLPQPDETRYESLEGKAELQKFSATSGLLTAGDGKAKTPGQ